MDFSLILFLLVLITGLAWLGWWWFFERQSQPAAPRPWAIEYARVFFPVVLAVFLVRSFVVEPFRIPSGSMLPSLYVGDFLLVNKFTYGIRLPVINRKIIDLGAPKRGDVMVFRYPLNPKVNYIKRVVGLPGDVVAYRNKQLLINGTPASRTADGRFYFDQLHLLGKSSARFTESIDDAAYSIIVDPDGDGRDMEVTVPAESYFVMGDNRDRSNDSRFWRFVPEENIVGRAFVIWMSWKGFSNGGVRWNRLGESVR